MRFKTILSALFILIISQIGFAQEEEELIFTITEQMPEYIGGQEAMYEYLSNNLKYPDYAKDAFIQGIVYVTFVVTETGKVTDVRILRGIGGGCDEEALRVVSEMPYWIPGTQRGKKVKVQYNLPIRFTLGSKKKTGLFKRLFNRD